jgi:CRISPR-associated protein Csx16
VNLIITRHPGAVEWLARKGITGRLVEHATGDEGAAGDSVYGPIPIDLAEGYLRRGLAVYFIAMPKLSLDRRKGELSVVEMTEAGATLVRVSSIRLDSV